MPYKDPEVARQKSRERYLAKREQILAQCSKYAKEHREQRSVIQKRWNAKHKEELDAYYRQWRKDNLEKCRQKNSDYKERMRVQVFEHYGNRCQCCGEDRREFFSMDHVHGGGNKHRREAKITNSADLFLWIIRHGFPDDFRILCHNCNMSKGFYGYCPHEREPEYGIEPAC